MRLQFNVSDLRDACEEAYGHWYGRYKGRAHFDGYGAVFKTTDGLVRLGVALERHGLGALAKVGSHVDSMGTGLIIAWDKSLFYGFLTAADAGLHLEEKE